MEGGTYSLVIEEQRQSDRQQTDRLEGGDRVATFEYGPVSQTLPQKRRMGAVSTCKEMRLCEEEVGIFGVYSYLV